MIDIKTNMQFMSKSVSAMISSTMEKILKKISDRSKDEEGHVIQESENPDEVSMN